MTTPFMRATRTIARIAACASAYQAVTSPLLASSSSDTAPPPSWLDSVAAKATAASTAASSGAARAGTAAIDAARTASSAALDATRSASSTALEASLSASLAAADAARSASSTALEASRSASVAAVGAARTATGTALEASRTATAAAVDATRAATAAAAAGASATADVTRAAAASAARVAEFSRTQRVVNDAPSAAVVASLSKAGFTRSAASATWSKSLAIALPLRMPSLGDSNDAFEEMTLMLGVDETAAGVLSGLALTIEAPKRDFSWTGKLPIATWTTVAVPGLSLDAGGFASAGLLVSTSVLRVHDSYAITFDLTVGLHVAAVDLGSGSRVHLAKLGPFVIPRTLGAAKT